jgi:hypothetical protein
VGERFSCAIDGPLPEQLAGLAVEALSVELAIGVGGQEEVLLRKDRRRFAGTDG